MNKNSISIFYLMAVHFILLVFTISVIGIFLISELQYRYNEILSDSEAAQQIEALKSSIRVEILREDLQGIRKKMATTISASQINSICLTLFLGNTQLIVEGTRVICSKEDLKVQKHYFFFDQANKNYTSYSIGLKYQKKDILRIYSPRFYFFCVLLLILISFLLSIFYYFLAHLFMEIKQLVFQEKQHPKFLFIKEISRLFEMVKSLEIAKMQDVLHSITTQVAHDIRSPLAALDMATNNLKELPEEKRLIIRNSVSRIRDIANDLLNRNRASEQNNANSTIHDEKIRTELLQSLLDPLITEKRLQYRSKLEIEIVGRIDSSGYGLFAAIQPTEFKRVLSNLINNSVEAFNGAGKVTISLKKSEHKNILVEIKDNGKGIPEHILAKLGSRGETHGKEGGSGLGFYHAKKSVEAWGGQLSITSQVGQGTTVTIHLPQAKIPHWFVPKLLVQPRHQIVILDDDSSIHQIWQGRFESALCKKLAIQLHHFSTELEIQKWKDENSTQLKQVIYLVDYELIGQKKSGLDIIEALAISQEAILVTSRYEEENIRRRCEQLGIKMIPKGLAGFVPIEELVTNQQNHSQSNYENCDCVLIDDDALVRMTWDFAAKDVSKKLKVFASPQDFFAIREKIDPKTPIYIDSHLGEGLQGEKIAQELYEKYGFCEIYLATGYAATQFDLSKMPYLKGIIGKDNPWV